MINKYLNIEADEAYEKFKRSRGILGFTLGKTEELKSFREVQNELKAFNNSYLGIRTVPLDQIVGSVGKIEDFDKNFIPRNKIVKNRWCNIYKEMVSKGNLPPVQLYKIKDEYFAYDGNHRISVAKYLNSKSTEAEVTEFFPSTDDPKDVIHWEKFYFFKQTEIDEIFTENSGTYELLVRKIQDFEKKIKRVNQNITFKEAAKLWYNNIYKPITEILEINGINEETRKEKFGDIFIDFLDFKNYLEEGGQKVFGYCYSLIHFLNKSKKNYNLNWKNSIYLDSYLIKLFLNLYKNDIESSLSLDKLHKLIYIRQYFQTNISNEIKIVNKMEKYFNENNLTLSLENMDLWNTDFFEPLYSRLTAEVNKRSIPCFINNPSILEDKGKMFLELLAYKKIYEKSYERKISDLELVLLFILDIALPLGKVIEENKIPKEELPNIYFVLSKRFANYLSLNSEVSFETLYKLYDQGNKNIVQERLKSLIFNKNHGVPELFSSLKASLSSNDAKLLDELLENYGKSFNYKTEFYLKMFKEEYEEKDDITFIQKLSKDFKELANNSEITMNFNTYILMEFIKDSPYPYTLFDFYVAILRHCSYLGPDRHYIDIITLALEYIHSFKYEL